MIKWTHWPAVRPGEPTALAEEWIGQSEFGTFSVLRTSYKTLGTPWRIKYPTGATTRAENIDAAKRTAEKWVALQYQERGSTSEQKKP
jgi:hypothetical protein